MIVYFTPSLNTLGTTKFPLTVWFCREYTEGLTETTGSKPKSIITQDNLVIIFLVLIVVNFPCPLLFFFFQSEEHFVSRLATLTTMETKALLAKYFEKVIDLRDAERKKDLHNSELEVDSCCLACQNPDVN